MANNEEGGGFVTGFLFGGVIGFLVGILTAPRAGNELRAELMERTHHFREQAEIMADQARLRAEGFASDARNRAQHLREQASTVADQARDQSKDLPPPGVVPAEYVPPPPGQQGILEKAAALMTGTRFRWVQGSKDVAYGLYGAPVMLNLWSCTDKNIDATLEWLKVMEKTYSDQMLSILVPANVAERSLTGQDNICGRSIRFGRSLGVDVGKGVMHELDVKELPTTLVFDSGGNVVAKHEGPLTAESDAAKKLETALQREMAPVIEGRTLAP